MLNQNFDPTFVKPRHKLTIYKYKLYIMLNLRRNIISISTFFLSGNSKISYTEKTRPIFISHIFLFDKLSLFNNILKPGDKKSILYIIRNKAKRIQCLNTNRSKKKPYLLSSMFVSSVLILWLVKVVNGCAMALNFFS